jgi:hypothetical protein
MRPEHNPWKRPEPPKPLPTWLVMLLTPLAYAAFLGVLLLVVPVGLLLRYLFAWY